MKSEMIWFSKCSECDVEMDDLMHKYLIKEVDDAAVWPPIFRKQSPLNQVVDYTSEKRWDWLNVVCKSI